MDEEPAPYWGPIVVNYHPSIGDPDLLGWLTTFLFLLVGALCLDVFVRATPRKGREEREPNGDDGALTSLAARPSEGRARSWRAVGGSLKWAAGLLWTRRWPERQPLRSAMVWLFVGLLVVFMGLNKQLDLQTLFTEVARAIARSMGWWESRRPVQAVFLGVLVLGFGAVVVVAAKLARGSRPAVFALVGTVALLGFVVLRAGNIHHVFEMVGVDVGLPLARVLELGGAVIIGLSARRV